LNRTATPQKGPVSKTLFSVELFLRYVSHFYNYWA